MIKKILLGFILFMLLILVVGFSKTGGITTTIALPPGEKVTDFELAGLHCETYRIPTRLSERSWFDFDVIGELCWTGELTGKTVQMLIAGAGYGTVYWDFPYKPDTYSYKRAALRDGYATFNYYRTGIGESDHPFGLSVTVESHAHVLSQLIDYLNAQAELGPVVTVGHSLGSVIAIAHALQFPNQVNGIILTGFIHNSNPAFNLAMRSGSELAPFTADFAGDIVDPLYMISKQGSRKEVFYNLDNTDPLVPVTDELNRQTLTVGEIISMIKYFDDLSKAIQVPVLIVTGENDFVVCGGALECDDHQAVIEFERQFFSPQACIETIILDHTGHDVNLHKNAPQSYRLMLDWVGRRVDVGCDGA